MDDFWTLVGFPILVLIIGFVIEYWIIQPLRYSYEFRDVPKRYRRDWVTATATAIKSFRKKQSDYNGILRRRHIQIEEKEVKHGHAIIIIGISEKRYFWENFRTDPRIIKRVELTIDRTGDILAIKPLVVSLEMPPAPGHGIRNIFTKKKATSNHPNPYAVYLYVLVGLLGASGVSTSPS